MIGVMDSSGNLVNAYVYDPYGNLFEQNEAVANPWQYASGYLDSTTGLYHFGARYYNPTLGRWTQEDPAGPTLTNPDSLNPYLYVDDSSVNYTDQSGRDLNQLIICITGIIGDAFLLFGADLAIAPIILALGLTSPLGIVLIILAIIGGSAFLIWAIFSNCGEYLNG